MNKKKLLKLLKKYKIPLKLWGTGEAKTLDHLIAEISSGEAVLEEGEGGLLRVALGVCLDVFYKNKNVVYKLIEEKQVYKDGRVRRRGLPTSIGEKLKPNEDPIFAAYRALFEELGIKIRLVLLERPGIIKGPVPSISFPGLKTKYIFSVFEVWLPKEFYKPEGYIENQSDKSSHFIWKKQSSV